MWSQTGFPCYSFSFFVFFPMVPGGSQGLAKRSFKCFTSFYIFTVHLQNSLRGWSEHGRRETVLPSPFFWFQDDRKMTDVTQTSVLKTTITKYRHVWLCHAYFIIWNHVNRPTRSFLRVTEGSILERELNEVGFDAARGDRPECKRDNWLKANNWTS